MQYDSWSGLHVRNGELLYVSLCPFEAPMYRISFLLSKICSIAHRRGGPLMLSIRFPHPPSPIMKIFD